MLKNYSQIDNQNRKNSDILNVVQIKPGINVKKDNSKDRSEEHTSELQSHS